MGLRRIWSRGIKQANKIMLGAATAYNLKKWIKYIMRKSGSTTQQKTKCQTNEAKKVLKGLLSMISTYSTLYRTVSHQNTPAI
jgi:hypothetical protein